MVSLRKSKILNTLICTKEIKNKNILLKKITTPVNIKSLSMKETFL